MSFLLPAPQARRSLARSALLFCAAVAAAAFVWIASTASSAPAPAGGSSENPRKRFSLVQGEVTFDPAPGGEVLAVLRPRHFAVSKAPVDESEWVLGVTKGDTAIAYPIRALAEHEVVNDWLGALPIAVTWSPSSGSAAVYVRRLGERVLTLGVSDRLWRGHRVLFDGETHSLWSELLGECLRGDLEAQRFGEIGAVIARWPDWKRAYPESHVLDSAGASRVAPPYGAPNAAGAASASASGTETLSPKDRVFGILAGRTAKAYSLAQIRREGVLEDRIGRMTLVFFYDEPSGAVAAYSRGVSGLEVHFEKASDGSIRDVGTQSRWDWLKGSAIEGKMAGVALTRLPAIPAYWSAWEAVFPNGEIYRERAASR